MVPVLDLSRRDPELTARYLGRVRQIIESGIVLLGPETAGFESELAHWAGAADSVAVASGASALQLALAALGVGPGDEVIVPAFTAVPTAAAVCAVGATPVFVDVDRDTAGLDPALVEASRTSRTAAVIVVHLYGRPAELPQTDLAIIEDAAQAQGAIDRHDRSAAVVYSFYPTKNLGGIGDGGAVVSNDIDLIDRVRRLRGHGMTQQYVHEEISQNFRMSELEAAWLRLGLTELDAWNGRRRQIAAHYRSAAPQLDWHDALDRHVYHLCVARFADRSAARQRLGELGVATAVHYPLALTQQPAYRQFTTTPCPLAEEWAAQCVSLPCFAQMTDTEIDQVADALASMARSLNEDEGPR